jgi:hypothetical protein
MLLRSISKHATDQNWFAVFLDLVIVVIGVFIGIEVANWNADRADEKKVEVLLDRLHGDLNYDTEVLMSLRDYHAVVKNYAVTAVDGINQMKSVNDEQFVIAAYQASQISGPWNYRSAYNELITSGRFDLIDSDELKSLILGYYSDNWTQQPEMLIRAPYREYIRGNIPFQIQDAIRSECGDVAVPIAQTFAFTLPEECDLQLPDALFNETAAYLRSQPELLIKLRYQIAVYESQVASLTNFGREAQQLMAVIDEFRNK